MLSHWHLPLSLHSACLLHAPSSHHENGLVLPQFHCIYDDAFEMVHNDAKFQSLWQQKAKLQPHAETNSVNWSPTDPTLKQDYANLPSYRDQLILIHLHQLRHALQQRDALLHAHHPYPLHKHAQALAHEGVCTSMQAAWT